LHIGRTSLCRAWLLCLPAILVQPFERSIRRAGRTRPQPLLQDIGLAYHSADALSRLCRALGRVQLRVGALLTRQVNPNFAARCGVGVGAWIFLTLGITAGSYWAYYELGWGGWWFWDPTENASLMPWLAATALLHSASVLAARRRLRAWTIISAWSPSR